MKEQLVFKSFKSYITSIYDVELYTARKNQQAHKHELKWQGIQH